MSRLPVSSELNKIAKAIDRSGGQGILVGGAVRDHFMDRRISKDLDVEVFGLSMQELESVLQKFGNIHAAGKSFGVLKLKTPSRLLRARSRKKLLPRRLLRLKKKLSKPLKN